MNRENDGMTIGSLIVIGVVIALIATLCFTTYGWGYADGQEDAYEGKWNYEQVQSVDGHVTYERLRAPSTRPAIVSAQ